MTDTALFVAMYLDNGEEGCRVAIVPIGEETPLGRLSTLILPDDGTTHICWPSMGDLQGIFGDGDEYDEVEDLMCRASCILQDAYADMRSTAPTCPPVGKLADANRGRTIHKVWSCDERDVDDDDRCRQICAAARELVQWHKAERANKKRSRAMT